MKSIYAIAQVAREKAQEALEEYVKLSAGFSGVDINKAKTDMIVHYDQALWKGLISMTKEHYSEKDTENDLESLLSILSRRGATVEPVGFSWGIYKVQINDTWYYLKNERGRIKVGKIFNTGKILTFDEDVIADILQVYEKIFYPIPDCYEAVCRKLEIENKELQLIDSTVMGMLQDILTPRNADISVDGIEIKFTLTNGDVKKEFHSCLGYLRDDKYVELAEIDKMIANKS